MFVIVELNIYGYESGGHPCGAYGPFETLEQANEIMASLEVEGQDDPVEFMVLSLMPGI